jgi:REP-associated tyrosine transposase
MKSAILIFMGRQMKLPLPQRGGAHKGAGRPRTRSHPGLIGPGVPHLTRTDFAARHPVHITQRVQPGVGYLRAHSRAQVIQAALQAARERFGMRVVHYSIQGNHLHLIVEAEGAKALSQAMRGLGTRLARRLNSLAGRRGKVFVDRYHGTVLTSRRQVANARRYVLENHRHHTREHLGPEWRDPLSTAAAPLAPPRTWLLRAGFRLPGP